MDAAPQGDLFKSLNKAQCRAVSSRAPTLAILAGPGSGKTHTLTSRVVWLIDHLGIRPCDVIVATFTVKAASEMKSRIGSALADGREKKIVLGTFHSIARRYLAAYGNRVGLDRNFAIADDGDSRGIIQRICKRLAVPIEPAMARAWISKRKAKGTSDEQTAKAKNGKAIESQALEQCFEEYQAHLKRSNLLDYDDLLVLCVELLRKFPSCVANVQAVLIDEYQDTNGIQYDLMKLFAQKQRRITVVGDPDQSIYGWRSAEIKNLHRLLREFPGTDEVALEENYRSSRSILDTSLNVIQQDEARYKKVLLPVRDRGTRPVLRRLASAVTEADWIVSELKRVQLMSGGMVAPNDIAILLRSAALSRYIEHALGREGVGYRMVGGLKFYERAEIKILLDYLRIIHQPDNNDALARIINKPKRGIGDQTIKSLIEESERNSMSLWTLLLKHCRGERTAKTTIRKQMEQKLSGDLIKLVQGLRSRFRNCEGEALNLVEIIEKLLHDLQFQKFLEETTPEPETRWANVQEFVALAGEFMKNLSAEEEDSLPTINGLQQNVDNDVLARFLANVSLASDKQKGDKDEDGKPLITISTIHAAKGLEWPVVFIPAVYKGSIPHMRSDDDAEERRLLFVAMTRAKALLYLSHPLNAGHGGTDGNLQLSPFIEDISSAHFLKKGPSLERRTMTEISRILGRELPSEESIYKAMPPMQAIEDDRFPVDPTQSSTSLPGRNNGSDYRSGEAPRKRQKLGSAGAESETTNSHESWVERPSTTMEKSSSFTIPQPTFTTAGAHHAQVVAATAVAATTAANITKPIPAKSNPSMARRQVSNRPPSQRSLLGYGYGVTNHDNSPSLPPVPPAMPAQMDMVGHKRIQGRPSQADRYQLPYGHDSRATETKIDPNLAKHKLGSAKIPGKPHVSRDPEQAESQAKKVYACFSSSPTKGGSPEREMSGNGNKAPPPPPLQQLEKENKAPPEEQVRPAASFHTTTVNRPPGWGGMGRGINRPTPLGRSSIAPMDKLKRPFKLPSKRP